MTYTAEAKIPEGAQLIVREITPEDPAYADYVGGAQDAIAGDQVISYAKFFDITIVSAEGEKIEPAAAVQVNIA